jgi:hypothetical protein
MGRGRPVTVGNTRHLCMRATEDVYERLMQLGDGNLSAGLRKLHERAEMMDKRRRGNVNDVD